MMQIMRTQDDQPLITQLKTLAIMVRHLMEMSPGGQFASGLDSAAPQAAIAYATRLLDADPTAVSLCIDAALSALQARGDAESMTAEIRQLKLLKSYLGSFVIEVMQKLRGYMHGNSYDKHC